MGESKEVKKMYGIESYVYEMRSVVHEFTNDGSGYCLECCLEEDDLVHEPNPAFKFPYSKARSL